jgi:hypothetical protein
MTMNMRELEQVKYRLQVVQPMATRNDTRERNARGMRKYSTPANRSLALIPRQHSGKKLEFGLYFGRIVHPSDERVEPRGAGEHLTRVHSELYNFDVDRPSNGFTLLGQVYGAHSPLPKTRRIR